MHFQSRADGQGLNWLFLGDGWILESFGGVTAAEHVQIQGQACPYSALIAKTASL